MPDTLVTTLRTHPARESFFALAQKTFSLDLASWAAQGYWTDTYRPYALVRDGRVLANASANLLRVRDGNAHKRFVQIGTVMTDEDFRHQGLMRQALGALLEDWRGRCDLIYLYANDSVRDFYPKFGFVRAQEYVHSAPLAPCPGDFYPLQLDNPEHLALMQRHYAQGNPYSALEMLDNWPLVMFYCSSFMKEHVFYSPRRHAVCVAQSDGDTLRLWDVFGAPDVPLTCLAAELAAPQARRVVLGFTPASSAAFSCQPLIEEDTTLFVLRGGDTVFERAPVRMPELSRA